MTDDARAKRLKAALRDNLHRRKSQARGRADEAASRDGDRRDAGPDREPPASMPGRRDE